MTRHCNGEPSTGEPHYRLMALLKDADGLDRVRLGDLRPEWLRHDAARTMVDFAQRLFASTTTYDDNVSEMPRPRATSGGLWPRSAGSILCG